MLPGWSRPSPGRRIRRCPRGKWRAVRRHPVQRSHSVRNWLMPSTKVWPGLSYPLGATCDGKGVNFALFSAHAEKVELCLFDRTGQYEQARIVLPEYTDEVWHCYLPEERPDH